MKQVQFPASLNKMETLSDGSIKLVLETQELNGADMTELFGYRNQVGYVTFTPNRIDHVEVPKEMAVSDDGKSPSQRLRAVLYVAWEQSGKKVDTFEQYYGIQMERILNQLKDRLDHDKNTH